MHQRFAAAAADASERRLARCRRDQQDLRVIGTEKAPCCDQQLAHGKAEFGRPLCGSHRFVEELEVLPLFALGHVGPECKRAGDGGEDKKEAGLGPRVDEHDARESEARGRERTDQGDHQGLCKLRRGESGFDYRDHGRDEDDADGVRDRRRDQDQRPGPHAVRVAVVERAKDEKRDAAAQRQLREIEREFHRALPAMHGECDARSHELGREQRRGRNEEQTKDEPELGQGQGVCLLAELQVHDVDLCEVERDGELPPLEREVAREWLEARNVVRPDSRRRDGDGEDEQPGTRRPQREEPVGERRLALDSRVRRRHWRGFLLTASGYGSGGVRLSRDPPSPS